MVPSGRVPEGSIASPDFVVVRHAPTPSKFSSAKPIGTIILWQAAQGGFGLWISLCLRMVTFFVVTSSFSEGTLGGGGGGCVPKSCSRTHLPRIVGAVRLE